jgi:hypothetical protein
MALYTIFKITRPIRSNEKELKAAKLTNVEAMKWNEKATEFGNVKETFYHGNIYKKIFRIIIQIRSN